MIVAAGWPGMASAGIHGTGPVGPGPAPSARPWLLGQAAPALLPPAAPAAQAVSTDVYVAPLKHVLPVDVVAVSATTLPAVAVDKVRDLPGVRAVQAVDAARVRVNGRFAAVLGVNPSGFRRFAAKPTAKDTAFWRSVESGGLGLSYEMSKQDKLPAGTSVTVAGRSVQTMRVGKFGTVGIGGVDAVITDKAARSLGFPVRNAIVISAPSAHFTKLTREIKKALPHGTVVDQLVVQTGQGTSSAAASAAAGSVQPTAGGLASATVIHAFLEAAVSRLGMPYVWGAAGPWSFDCSGLVQWSFRQAGVVMPRVAADQARTGPSVPVSQLQPGDLLFYHTDPTAPDYISHVAIYLGDGKMIQAPEPGMNVEVVPVDLGSEFAGAVDVSPTVAAQVAATSV
ncbi:MAG TPA: C40 family peptidase [Streptosporangiaceae bacterium]|jgi:cell wall-associated NlpC family hydrolase